ncbi:hypothetical protein A8924_5074 [Saccharopolyspora erythraea NRRL 2338]|nr:hypothetical protein A8924_5074 [Saccharopolyspora erythraea NRRL 2338]
MFNGISRPASCTGARPQAGPRPGAAGGAAAPDPDPGVTPLGTRRTRGLVSLRRTDSRECGTWSSVIWVFRCCRGRTALRPRGRAAAHGAVAAEPAGPVARTRSRGGALRAQHPGSPAHGCRRVAAGARSPGAGRGGCGPARGAGREPRGDRPRRGRVRRCEQLLRAPSPHPRGRLRAAGDRALAARPDLLGRSAHPGRRRHARPRVRRAARPRGRVHARGPDRAPGGGAARHPCPGRDRQRVAGRPRR